MHPSRKIVRLVPELPFPPYAFIPGRLPHPVSDPAGHSFGKAPIPAVELTIECWQSNRVYLFGIDLFNGEYFWESHVEFESLWLAAGRKGIVADFLKGWIKLAAAGVKHLAGQRDGVASHAARAAELWHATMAARGPDAGKFLGFHLADLIDLAEETCQAGWPTPAPIMNPVDHHSPV